MMKVLLVIGDDRLDVCYYIVIIYRNPLLVDRFLYFIFIFQIFLRVKLACENICLEYFYTPQKN
jgi:hypothetical protein